MYLGLSQDQLQARHVLYWLHNLSSLLSQECCVLFWFEYSWFLNSGIFLGGLRGPNGVRESNLSLMQGKCLTHCTISGLGLIWLLIVFYLHWNRLTTVIQTQIFSRTFFLQIKAGGLLLREK